MVSQAIWFDRLLKAPVICGKESLAINHVASSLPTCQVPSILSLTLFI
jgi:hypothetical protein